MRRQLAPWAAAGVVLAAAALVLPAPATAYCGRPESTVCPCNCLTSLEIPSIGRIEVAFSGHMSLYCVRKGTTNLGQEFADMISTDFTVRGFHPAVGTIEVRLDRSRFQELSNMTSLDPDQEFPARHDVLAHALVTFSEWPGVVWRSLNSFHIRSDAVRSFNPAVDERYELVEPVQFEDTANPGEVVGRMLRASIVVGGNGDDTRASFGPPAGGPSGEDVPKVTSAVAGKSEQTAHPGVDEH